MAEPPLSWSKPARNNAGPINAYVLDSHDYTRAMLIELLTTSHTITVIGSSRTAQRGLPDILRLRPHVAVIADDLDDGDGLDICHTLTTAAPDIATIILTAGTTRPWQPEQAAAAGAAAYLLKQAKGFPLLDIITTITQPPHHDTRNLNPREEP